MFSRLAPALLGIFPFLLMFLVTSIATLRERTSGTLERLMTTPLPKLALLGGYGMAFGVVALLQVRWSRWSSRRRSASTSAGSVGWLVPSTLVDALLGVALGLFASAFARTEFQAIQLMPVVVLPQLLLCGLFQPRERDGDRAALGGRRPAGVVRGRGAAARRRPRRPWTARSRRDLLVLVGFVLGAIVAGAATLRRRTP